MENQLYGVFYTDGGYRSSNHCGGWGVHGYFYEEVASSTQFAQKGWVITTTGYAVYDKTQSNTCVNPTTYVDALGGMIDDPTNNRAELQALIEALRLIETNGIDAAWIYSDSQYVVDGVNQRLSTWIDNGWRRRDGDALLNQDLWMTIHCLLEQLKPTCRITLAWIRGHASSFRDIAQDDLGNALADGHATAGILRAQCHYLDPLIRFHEGKRYWKPGSYRHPFLIHGRWYFNTASILADSTDTGWRLYYFGNHGKEDDFLGKPISDASFSVLMTKKPEPVLESIRHIEKALDQHAYNSLMIGRLDHIYKPTIYQRLQHLDGWCVKKSNVKLDLFTMDGLQLTKELRPPRMAYKLITLMEVLEGLLRAVLDNEPIPGVIVNDVTEQFYSRSSGKKKKRTVVDHFTATEKTITVAVHHALDEKRYQLPLSIGLDCPPRAVFSKLAPENPRIVVLTWRESAIAFRYALCVQTADTAAIYAGFYSNLIVLVGGHEPCQV